MAKEKLPHQDFLSRCDAVRDDVLPELGKKCVAFDGIIAFAYIYNQSILKTRTLYLGMSSISNNCLALVKRLPFAVCDLKHFLRVVSILSINLYRSFLTVFHRCSPGGQGCLVGLETR